MNNYISIIKSNGTFQFKNSMTSTFEWNLWEGKITDKFVILSAKKHYYDGLNEICLRICIRNGLWTISKKKDGVVYFQKKGHCNTSGTNPEIEIVLSNGAIYDRYCSVRDKKFVEFLRRHGLSSVRKVNPNQTYYGWDIYSARGNAYHNIYTDGKKDTTEEDCRNYEWENPNLYKNSITVNVSNASWVIEDSYNFWDDHHSHSIILYTTEDIYTLDELLPVIQ